MLRVVIADDHLLVREGLSRILEESGDVRVVAAVADGDALIAAVQRELPDVVVTDIRMPPSDADEGVRVAADLRDSHPEVGVVLLSQYADPGYALAVFREGSARRGYLLKNRLSDPRMLLAAIANVASGGSIVDPLIVEVLVQSRSRAESSPLRALTTRELQVLSVIAEGKSNSAIAGHLVITQRAVEHHISAIFAKLALPDEREASRRVMATLLYLAERETAA
jgi:DNA-binding NarL/FixJ family response regulator